MIQRMISSREFLAENIMSFILQRMMNNFLFAENFFFEIFFSCSCKLGGLQSNCILMVRTLMCFPIF
jgi:hypothetical protein